MRWVLMAIVLPIVLSFALNTSVDAKSNYDPASTPTSDSGWTVISLPDGALD